MARDYAGGGKSRQRAQASRPGLPGWVWAMAGLTLGLVVAGVVYIVVRPMPEGDAAPSVAAPVPTPAAKAEPQLPPRSKPRFKFYDLLPKSEVEAPAEKYEVKPSGENKPGTYIIQAGSFARAEDAERRKAEIVLNAGLDATVQKVDMDSGRTIYRVYCGPFTDGKKIRSARDRLNKNNVETLLVRVGD